MADQETSRLCNWIIRTHFGDLVATVADALISRGRLSFRDVVFFAKLKPRIIRASLLVLIQHNLLWHSDSDTDNGGEEIFEFARETCLMRLRYGEYLQLVRERFNDEEVADIVGALLDHGRLRLTDLQVRLSHLEKSKCSALVKTLLQKHFIKSTTTYLNKSRADRVTDLEQKLIAEDPETRRGAVAAAKKLAAKRSAAIVQVKHLEAEAESLGLKMNGESSKKRPAGKKDKEPRVDENVWFRVDLDKLNALYRNSLIESAVRVRYNEEAAIVMRAVLKASEDSQRNLTDTRSDGVSSHHILDELPSKVNLGPGIASKGKGSASQGSLLKDYLQILAAADNNTPTGRAAAFLSTSSTSSSSSKVYIEFRNIHTSLRKTVLFSYVRSRWGDIAVRVVKVLLEVGMADEKYLTKVGLMSPQHVRPIVSELQSAGLIELKEVPKGKDFAPSRTFYFWHLDLQKAYAVLLSNLTKTLANILERKAHESSLSGIKNVLEKRERSDVAQDEEGLLTRPEREMLKDWEEKMLRFSVLEQRVDQAAFVLRELVVD